MRIVGILLLVYLGLVALSLAVPAPTLGNIASIIGAAAFLACLGAE